MSEDELIHRFRSGKSTGDELMIIAVKHGYEKLLRTLLDADVSILTVSIMIIRSFILPTKGIIEMLITSPRAGIELCKHMFIGAYMNGYANLLKILLKNDHIDPTMDNNYAIRAASAYGNYEVVKLLLADSRVDPTADDNYAIKRATINGYMTVVRSLLERIGYKLRVCNYIELMPFNFSKIKALWISHFAKNRWYIVQFAKTHLIADLAESIIALM